MRTIESYGAQAAAGYAAGEAALKCLGGTRAVGRGASEAHDMNTLTRSTPSCRKSLNVPIGSTASCTGASKIVCIGACLWGALGAELLPLPPHPVATSMTIASNAAAPNLRPGLNKRARIATPPTARRSLAGAVAGLS